MTPATPVYAAVQCMMHGVLLLHRRLCYQTCYDLEGTRHLQQAALACTAQPLPSYPPVQAAPATQSAATLLAPTLERKASGSIVYVPPEPSPTVIPVTNASDDIKVSGWRFSACSSLPGHEGSGWHFCLQHLPGSPAGQCEPQFLALEPPAAWPPVSDC